MKKNSNHKLKAEYDFSKGVRGKYAKKFQTHTNVIVLEPDVLKNFPDSETVNETLRTLIKLANRKKVAA
ncbi:MAG: hypothetical protein ING84_14700 [Cytophagales bacterium]|jgi:hypothetical protein|nr:hypothetical protein [Cytophagales bacterium]MCE2895060.1 hypothetical protein [Flammeovirgaceae bacterium]MCA6366455.1 hypothetical protein [Cytophagales bacterium]MCA6373118.1 hypothetical protein [Cytophagales bacterium]MCA6375560.1 hypothetical protein [Cytophagales bacterium]